MTGDQDGDAVTYECVSDVQTLTRSRLIRPRAIFGLNESPDYEIL